MWNHQTPLFSLIDVKSASTVLRLPPPLVAFLPVSGAVSLAGGESRWLALHTHVVALAQVPHPAGVWAGALLAPLGQRGQLKLDTIPVARTDTQASGGNTEVTKAKHIHIFLTWVTLARRCCQECVSSSWRCRSRPWWLTLGLQRGEDSRREHHGG